MATDINLSLDDIIKKNKSLRNFNGRRRPGQQNTQGGRRNTNARNGGGKNFGGPRFRNNVPNRPRAQARFSPYKRGDIDSPWSHDLYEDNYVSKRIDYDGGTTVIISNLEFGVTDSDLEELFLEVGPLISSEIHYDKSGRSLGSGSVVFEDRTDAIRAIKQYNGVPLDGRPMKIEIATATPARMIDTRRLGGNFKNRNSRPAAGGGGGGGGGGRRRFSGDGNRNFGNRNRRNTNNLSAEQLDAELDEYRARAL